MAKFQRYRRKITVIEAAQITEPIEIHTLEGVMHGKVGDYLIIGIAGEQYPCRADIFEQVYELVEECEPKLTEEGIVWQKV